ncbi:MAG: cytochrome c5 family protein, partial [Gammaproteobacteria bacterium]
AKAPPPPPPAPKAVALGPPDASRGEKVYQQTCFACHGTGAAGAPKLGDKAAWEPRIAQGMDTLIQHALKGFKAMPAKGGNPGLSDQQVADAVAYMVEKSR